MQYGWSKMVSCTWTAPPKNNCKKKRRNIKTHNIGTNFLRRLWKSFISCALAHLKANHSACVSKLGLVSSKCNDAAPSLKNYLQAYLMCGLTCPIVDSIKGIMHVICTTEYNDQNEQYVWIQQALKLWTCNNRHFGWKCYKNRQKIKESLKRNKCNKRLIFVIMHKTCYLLCMSFFSICIHFWLFLLLWWLVQSHYSLFAIAKQAKAIL